MEVINLHPIVVEDTKNNNDLPINEFNSVFLYTFLIFEIIVCVYIVYFYFYIEVLFFYNRFKNILFKKDDEKIYKKYEEKIKNILNIDIKCFKEDGKYYPKYNDKNYLYSLDDFKIVYDNLDDCKKFI